MLPQSFLHTITIKTKTVTYTNGRQNLPNWSTSAAGVSATISPLSVRSKTSLLGPTTEEISILFAPYETALKRDDQVIDEATGRVYVVMTNPVKYLNPVTGGPSHLQCEIKPQEPNE
jgi:hypothetical protein